MRRGKRKIREMDETRRDKSRGRETFFSSIAASFCPSLMVQHVKVSCFDQIASLNDITLYQDTVIQRCRSLFPNISTCILSSSQQAISRMA